MSNGIHLGRMWCFVGGFKMRFLNDGGSGLEYVESEDLCARHDQPARGGVDPIQFPVYGPFQWKKKSSHLYVISPTVNS